MPMGICRVPRVAIWELVIDSFEDMALVDLLFHESAPPWLWVE